MNMHNRFQNALAVMLSGAAILTPAVGANAGFVIADPDDALTALVDPTESGLVANEAGNITVAEVNALTGKVVFHLDESDNSGPDNQFGTGLEADALFAITSATAGSTPFSATVVASGGGYAVLTGATASTNGASSTGGRLATNRTSVAITFDTAVQVFGAVVSGLDDSGSGNGTVEYFNGSTSLGSFEASLGLTNFVGYDAGSSVITSVVISNSAPGSEFTLDDFVVSVAVPEPASFVLIGLGAVAIASRRKRA